jgi:hypothetical protein
VAGCCRIVLRLPCRGPCGPAGGNRTRFTRSNRLPAHRDGARTTVATGTAMDAPVATVDRCRRPRCRSGRFAVMSGDWAANALLRHAHSGWLGALGRNRTGTVTRFAGGQLHQELPRGMRTHDWTRTSDTRRRRTVLYPLSYVGMVGAEGFEPTAARCSRVTAGPDSPTSARPHGDPGGSRTLTSGATSQRSAVELQETCPWRETIPRPPACRAGALPLSYTGLVPASSGVVSPASPPLSRRGDVRRPGIEPGTACS